MSDLPRDSAKPATPATPASPASPATPPSPEACILETRALRFAYGAPPRGCRGGCRGGRGGGAAMEILRGIDLRCRLGELVCILGRNGCGKTTLLRCMIGLLSPRGGEVLVAGRAPAAQSARELARTLSYVPQVAGDAPDYSVAEVVRMGRSPHMGLLGVPGEMDLRICRAAMEMTDTAALAARNFASLSGGEKQTVMIARALAQQPRVMLLDEPTSSLDLGHQLDIYAMMARLAHEWGIAVVCVSHDVNLAARFADRLVMLSGGCVAADGAPEAVIRRETLAEVYGVEVRLIDAGQRAALVVADRTVRP